MCFSSSIPGYKYLDPLIYRLRCARKLWNRERERTSETPWDVKSVFPVFPLISCKQTWPFYFFLCLFFFQLATHKNAVGVAVGACLGHTICTSVAVVGGSMLASKISQKTVATVGGLLFLGFSLSSYFYPPL